MFDTRLVTASALLSFGSSLQNIWTANVPEPYMDEIFHIPQAQQYCSGNYSYWDPKITTPPGLYIGSVGILFLTSLILQVPLFNLCTVRNLRLTNLVYLPLTFLIVSRILGQAHRPVSKALISIAALVITFFPLNFFFNFMYYTDVGSSFWVLCCLSFASTNQAVLSGIAGFISMWFRQTNVVWMGVSGLLLLEKRYCWREKLESLPLAALPRFIFFALGKAAVVIPIHVANVLFAVWFISWNNGIVLGDKSNHVAGIHIPQLFYFFSFAAVWILPHFCLKDAANFYNFVVRVSQNAKLQLCVGTTMLAVLAAVHFNTIEHPFLLADNRHYTFYIWKDIYRASPYSKYALVPGYCVSGFYLWSKASSSFRWFYAFLFVAATFAVLVPSPLLEFRYFVLPFLFYRLQINSFTKRALFGELFFYLTVNLVTVYIFLYQTIDRKDGTIRFIW